ncbi:CLUMA_CG005356, isoform A [Clunio marinus]|uniref:Xanthine dehydrogenase n=1 Tax=Clunio marinus TaxID=568069 RepID=A0A1J1HYU3_9DIPT|nr:CLUMA_CG005356, isoform A [Clunio marinus]
MATCEKIPLTFFVNGKKISDNEPDPDYTLLRYLREKLRLCGTKLGCDEGGCGACTVMLSRYDRKTKTLKHLAVNACLTPICSVHGLAVTTVEGIGSTRTRLHPVQERISKAHGSQCGFCTPGIVMSMYALLRSTPKPNMKDLEATLQGNLCRCTGYRPIIEGFRTFTADYECGMGDKCCKLLNGNECGVEVENKLYEPNHFASYDPSQEPIFPPELKLSDIYDQQTLKFTNDRNVVWFRPTSLKQLLEFKKAHNDAKIVVGNTEVGIEIKSKNLDYKLFASPLQIDELTRIEVNEKGIKVGSAVTLTELETVLKQEIEIRVEHETRLFKAILEMLHWFGGQQVRNVASVGGNIMTASPISDLNPIFAAAGIELEVESFDFGRKTIKMRQDFFTGYRKNIIKDSEVLISISLPRTFKNQYFLAYKQAKRRDDDIAIVNAAFNVVFKEETNIIDKMELAFGGMAATTILASKTSNAVKGKTWDRSLIEIANKSLIEEVQLSSDAPGGMIRYRRSLTLSLFFKMFLAISQELEKTNQFSLIDEREKSGARTFHTLLPKSSQLFEKVSTNQPAIDPIYRPKVHSSAFKHATGEAVYCDDIPKFEGELYLALVLSEKAHAKIISIDATEALNQFGVHAFLSAKDLPKQQNQIGPLINDEELFISEIVTSQGQALGAIVADNKMIARRAARLVKVVYEDLFPVIVTIEDAIKHKSFFSDHSNVLTHGDVENAFKIADQTLNDEFRIGGQEHFYLETQAAIAVPKDGDELEIFASTQQPGAVQKRVAQLLNIPTNRITVRTKRIGGGFGGKETRSAVASMPVAFAAYTIGKPVRMMLDRDEDMMISGTRHPFLFKYKLAFMNDGKIIGLDIQIYNNAGFSLDFSALVMEKAVLSITNAYEISNVRIESKVLKTNLPTNTAFRGFGQPQASMVSEHIIRDVARFLKKDYLDIMTINMMKDGDLTHYKQLVENCTMRRCFDEVRKNSELERRSLEVKKFNEQNRWRKRGISLVNTMFSIGFSEKFLNQAGALVHIYTDGHVLISHGGVEMGQGLHIKMLQVASNVLKTPIEKIHLQETATDKVPNATSTAASVSTDMYGGAVMEACKILYDRLTPYRERKPEKNWDEWVNDAYFDRVSLSATGFFRTDDIGEDVGKIFNYFTNGSGVSEVEIDCLTGDHQVIRTDIVMDVGSSINPAIDIGQIEGGFMQGYGLFTMEELIYSPEGKLYSRGPGMYKIPGFADIPAEFNVSLLTGAPNPRAVYSSKAIGEPPLFIASSVYFAIKEAIGAARLEENLDPHFNLSSPATVAKIRMACQDDFTNKIKEDGEGCKSWNIMP